jgi:hypothetical protein
MCRCNVSWSPRPGINARDTAPGVRHRSDCTYVGSLCGRTDRKDAWVCLVPATELPPDCVHQRADAAASAIPDRTELDALQLSLYLFTADPAQIEDCRGRCRAGSTRGRSTR